MIHHFVSAAILGPGTLESGERKRRSIAMPATYARKIAEIAATTCNGDVLESVP